MHRRDEAASRAVLPGLWWGPLALIVSLTALRERDTLNRLYRAKAEGCDRVVIPEDAGGGPAPGAPALGAVTR